MWDDRLKRKAEETRTIDDDEINSTSKLRTKCLLGSKKLVGERISNIKKEWENLVEKEGANAAVEKMTNEWWSHVMTVKFVLMIF